MHKFDVNSIAKLDSLERRILLPPNEIIQKFGLAAGDVVADVGCGIDYFTFPASSIVGPAGKVFAMDISEEMLEQVRNKAHAAGTENIETIKVDENNFFLKKESIDTELVFFVLHETQELSLFLLELSRILKPGGKLAIIDWEKRATPNGPPVDHRIARDEAVASLTQAGFEVKYLKVGDEFYGLQCNKPA